MAKIKREQNPTRNKLKVSRKAKGKSKEVFPEVKIFLDGSEVIIITEGFSKRDIEIILDIIFNDPKGDEISNDQYLENIWEELHYGQS